MLAFLGNLFSKNIINFPFNKFYLLINLAPIILFYGVVNMVIKKHNNDLCGLSFSV